MSGKKAHEKGIQHHLPLEKYKLKPQWKTITLKMTMIKRLTIPSIGKDLKQLEK